MPLVGSRCCDFVATRPIVWVSSCTCLDPGGSAANDEPRCLPRRVPRSIEPVTPFTRACFDPASVRACSSLAPSTPSIALASIPHHLVVDVHSRISSCVIVANGRFSAQCPIRFVAFSRCHGLILTTTLRCHLRPHRHPSRQMLGAIRALRHPHVSAEPLIQHQDLHTGSAAGLRRHRLRFHANPSLVRVQSC